MISSKTGMGVGEGVGLGLGDGDGFGVAVGFGDTLGTGVGVAGAVCPLVSVMDVSPLDEQAETTQRHSIRMRMYNKLFFMDYVPAI